MSSTPTLKRSLSLPLITLYGLGTTIGAGIYVLIGEVTADAGVYAPVAFLLASGVAAFTALSFAELSSRFPKSAGEAVYVFEGFGIESLSVVVGLAIVAAGVVSSAAIANGFVGYFQQFVTLPHGIVVASVVVLLGLIASWGISESVRIAAVITVVEIGGLAMVVAVAAYNMNPETIDILAENAAASEFPWIGIVSGAVLAFYAYIGFEDMVNVAEETKDVTVNLPRAIVLTIILTTVLYGLLSVAAILVVPLVELGGSSAPLALVFERATGRNAWLISTIGMIAVLNGALIQIVMGSRILYGLGNQGWLPRHLSNVNSRTRTPLLATAIVTAFVLLFGLLLPLVTLAELTSLITLSVFALVNLALLRVKKKSGGPAGKVNYPTAVPMIGFAASSAFALFQFLEFVTRL